MATSAPAMPTRDTVFTAAGQPSITYVDRAHLNIEGRVRNAINTPNQIASIAGPSKSGKTVLCRKVLSNAQFIWIEGGQIDAAKEIWEKACYELNFPRTVTKSNKNEAKRGVKIGNDFFISVDGSQLSASETEAEYAIDSMSAAIRRLQEKKIALVIDDFHYLKSDVRKTFLRNVKGPVFNGLKLILLSVTHRGLDAVKAENELQGRVTSALVPEWKEPDLREIGTKGFKELNINCPPMLVGRLARESQNSPSLMQKLCWEICAGVGVDVRPSNAIAVSEKYDLIPLCRRIATEAGHPIYQKLEVGPQSRKPRMKRRLNSGGAADIYKAILMAIAATGPSAIIKYDDLRAKLSEILSDDPPQKHEITSALIHLAKISQSIGNDAGIDWDEDERKIDISDPYLRFYLRWQVRPVSQLGSFGGRLVLPAGWERHQSLFDLVKVVVPKPKNGLTAKDKK